MFSVHQQTIRLYEKEGLISPKRSEGNTRLFSEEDIDRLEEVIYLTHQLGINLAGVQMILKLKKKIAKMQKDMNKLFDQTQEQLDHETEQSKQAAKTSAQQLLQLKKPIESTTSNEPVFGKNIFEEHEQESDIDIDIENWELEYDDDE